MSLTSNFRRGARAINAAGGRKKKYGSWRDRLRLPSSPTPIIIVNGDYVETNPSPDLVELDPATGQPKDVRLPFCRIPTHTRKISQVKFRDVPCSAGTDPYNPQPCLSCMHMDQGDKTINLKDKFYFTVAHLGIYHRHPLWGTKDNQWVQKKETNEFVMVDDECVGRACNFCRVRAGHPPANLQQGEYWPNYGDSVVDVLGKKRYFEIGSGHLADLEAWDQLVSTRCQCGGEVKAVCFYCPTCNTAIIDAATYPGSDDELAKIVVQRHPCPTCRTMVALKEYSVCSSCNQTGTSQSMFDVVLHGLRQGEGTNSHMVLSKFESVEEFSKRVNPALLHEQTLQQRLEELTAEPFDFREIHKPLDPKAHADRMELNLSHMAPQYGAPVPGYGQPPMGFPQGQQMAPQQMYAQQPQRPSPTNGYAPQPAPFPSPPQFSPPPQFSNNDEGEEEDVPY